MKISEAIQELEVLRDCMDPRFLVWKYEKRRREALEIALEALKEVEKHVK